MTENRFLAAGDQTFLGSCATTTWKKDLAARPARQHFLVGAQTTMLHISYAPSYAPHIYMYSGTDFQKYRKRMSALFISTVIVIN